MRDVSSHVLRLEGDCKPFDTPKDFPVELQSRQPLAVNREPSVPRYHLLQIIQSQRICRLSSIHLHLMFLSPTTSPQTLAKVIHLWRQAHARLVGLGYSVSWPCTSWCTAVPFFLLFMKHYTDTPLRNSCPSIQTFSEITTFVVFSSVKWKLIHQLLVFCAATLRFSLSKC